MTASSLRSTPWLVVASQAQGSLFAPIRAQTRGIVLISLLLILASAAASLVASRILMQPIIGLTQVAEKISTGYLTARAQASTRDEIGSLASAFNNMTFQLRQALAGLETRVRERTADLEKSRQQSEGRAQRLQAISDVARAISVEQNLEKLLPLVASLVSEKFSFYHTGIFLLDSTRRFAVLRATNSPGGQRMLRMVGQPGVVHPGHERVALQVGIVVQMTQCPAHGLGESGRRSGSAIGDGAGMPLVLARGADGGARHTLGEPRFQPRQPVTGPAMIVVAPGISTDAAQKWILLRRKRGEIVGRHHNDGANTLEHEIRILAPFSLPLQIRHLPVHPLCKPILEVLLPGERTGGGNSDTEESLARRFGLDARR